MNIALNKAFLRVSTTLKHHRQKFEVHEWHIVLVKSEAKNRGKWPFAAVKAVFPGRDGVVRAVRVETGKGLLERPVQYLYPLELSCDQTPRLVSEARLNPEAEPYRPRRAAAAVAAQNIKIIAEQEYDF